MIYQAKPYQTVKTNRQCPEFGTLLCEYHGERISSRQRRFRVRFPPFCPPGLRKGPGLGVIPAQALALALAVAALTFKGWTRPGQGCVHPALGGCGLRLRPPGPSKAR